MQARLRGFRRTMFALVCAFALLSLSLTGCGANATGAPSGGSTGSAGGNVQSFSVDMSSGTYVPAELTAKADVPIEITFGQGRGCVRELVFPAFNVKEDMTKGPVTLKLGALKAGDYPWACGMDMEHGVLKVR
jgi:Cu+-exporting ATPase